MSVLAESVLSSWRDDPALFWRDMEPRNSLREDQERVVEAAARAGARVSFRAPRGWGKSTTLAAAALHWMATRPRSLVFAVTAAERQTRSLMAEIRSLFYGSDLCRIFPGWVVGVVGIETDDPTHRLVTASSDSPALLEGLHAENVMLLIDEGKSLGDDFFSSVLGTLAGATTSSVLATGTAGAQRGWFYRSFTADRERWQTFTFTPANSPHLADAIAAERERLGEKDVFFRAQYGAEFTTDRDSSALYDLASIERATGFDPYAGELWPTEKGRSLGVDPARSHDATVLAYWHGRRLVALKELGHADLMTQTGQVFREVKAFRAREVGVDANGLGMGLCDRLSELFTAENETLVHSPQNRVHVMPFVAGAKASPAGYERFYNLKSEVAWRLKSMLEEGRVGMTKIVADRLIPDLLAERLETRSDGRLKVVDPPGRSPDALDAALIGLWASQESASPSVVSGEIPGL